MASKSPRCSIVIRSFNEEKHLGRLLKAIQAQTFKDIETILVDSGSTDSTLEIAANYPVSIHHIQPKDFTFGRSLNQGIGAATGEIVVLASAHVIPKNADWIEKLTAPFSDSKMALTYGKQRGDEHTKYSEEQHFRSWFPEESDLDQQRAFANNANAAVRRLLWQQHPFDEALTGLEDVAWASWAKQEGHKIAYVTEAGVVHSHDENAAQIINRHRREAIALKQILPESRFSLRNMIGLTTRSIFADFSAARKEGVLLRETLGIKSFRALQYWGTYLGYRQSGEVSQELRDVFNYPPGSLAAKTSERSNGKPKSNKESAQKSR